MSISSEQKHRLPGNGTYLITVNDIALFTQVTAYGQSAGTVKVAYRPLLPLPADVTDLGNLTPTQLTALQASQVENISDDTINLATTTPRVRTKAIPDRRLSALILTVAGVSGPVDIFIAQS